MKRSRAQERKAAKDLGGRTTPGSGSRWHSKGDVVADEEAVECKTTSKQQYPLKAAVLEKILHEAYRMAKRPVLQVEFCHEGSRKYAVIPWEDYLMLTQRQR